MKDAHEQLLPNEGVRWTMIFVIFGLSLVVGFLVLYQAEAQADWLELPEASPGNVSDTRTRLAAVTEFMDEHPIWLGSRRALKEQTRLKNEIVRLETSGLLASAEQRDEQERRRLFAESARKRAEEHVTEGDLAGARTELQSALDRAPRGWPLADQTRRDIQAIDRQLEVNE